MRRASKSDALLVHTWQHAVSELLKRIKSEEYVPTLLSTRMVDTLLAVGFSPRDPEIRAYLVVLDQWAKSLKASATTLNENQTGLLGLWISISDRCGWQRGKHLDEVFCVSLEHNLQKHKVLSLAASVDLLSAVSAGLASIAKSGRLRDNVAQHLRELVNTANTIELTQLLQSLSLIKREKNIPCLDVEHKLDSVIMGDTEPVLDKAMAYFGRLQLASIFAQPLNIEYEIRFLECLGLLVTCNPVENNDIFKVYILTLPYLGRALSYESLHNAWKRYFDSALRRSKIENYLLRYSYFLTAMAVLAIVVWPWFGQLEGKYQVPIASGALTVVLTVTAATIEAIAELRGRQLWERKRVEKVILSIGVLVSLALAVVAALIQ